MFKQGKITQNRFKAKIKYHSSFLKKSPVNIYITFVNRQLHDSENIRMT